MRVSTSTPQHLHLQLVDHILAVFLKTFCSSAALLHSGAGAPLQGKLPIHPELLTDPPVNFHENEKSRCRQSEEPGHPLANPVQHVPPDLWAKFQASQLPVPLVSQGLERTPYSLPPQLPLAATPSYRKVKPVEPSIGGVHLLNLPLQCRTL